MNVSIIGQELKNAQFGDCGDRLEQAADARVIHLLNYTA